MAVSNKNVPIRDLSEKLHLFVYLKKKQDFAKKYNIQKCIVMGLGVKLSTNMKLNRCLCQTTF